MSSHTHTFGFLFIWFSCQASAVTFTQSSPQIVKESSEVQIKCSHDDTSLIMMLWYQQTKDSMSMTLIGFGYEDSQTYEGKFEEQFKLTRDGTTRGTLTIHTATLSHSAVYFCAASYRGRTDSGNSEAYFGGGTKLTVLEDGHNITSPKVEVLKPSKYECRNKKDENRKKTIVCVASGFYPDHVSVSWQLNKEKVTKGVATDNAALRDGETYKITSRLRVSAEDWFKPDNKFKCIVSFYNGTSEVNYDNSVNGEKAENTGSTMTKEQYLKVTHAGKLSYVVFIIKSCIYGVFVGFLVWKLQGSAGKVNI